MTPNLSTHEFAYQLRRLAASLLSGPDIPLSQLSFSQPTSNSTGTRRKSSPVTSQNKGDVDIIGAYTILFDVQKSDWIQILEKAEIPLTFRPRDASRDIIGRLFGYLRDNPDAQERLKLAVRKESSSTKSNAQLANALRTLLNVQ